MIETLQLEETAQVYDGPKFLIEWSSRWKDFPSSIGPAFSRSPSRLAGEAPHGLVPYRWMLASCIFELFMLFVIIVLPVKIRQMRPYVPPKIARHDVIYYSGDELPRTEDLGGSQSGTTGRAGGKEAHHRTQTIKIVRGGSLVQTVVDAPNLKLPASSDAVANLLAMKPNPGPPPSEGLRSARSAPALSRTVVPPVPNAVRDFTRGVQSPESVIPPAPSVSADHRITAPALNAAVIPPAPAVSRDHALIAPRLDSTVIAPAPNAARERTRATPALNGAIIPPAPSTANPETMRAPVQMTNVAVVPPPVSAPERETNRNAKLNMPSPSVIAPPAANVSPDLRRLASGSVPDTTRTVVPPPPSQPSGGIMSSLIGKIFGTTDVVPPPPTVSTESPSGSSRAPTPAGTGVGSNVVAPPPSVAGGSPTGRTGRGANSLATNVVPPPPSLSGAGHGNTSSAAGGPGGILANGNVVPPPPSVGGGTSPAGSGRSGRGAGAGGPLDTGTVLGPATNGGSGGGTAIVVSTQPGSKVGVPGNGGAGSLAMSPTGGDQPGIGGAGGGSGIGHGKDAGSGLAGDQRGAGRSGEGHGADPNARGGISPTTGPGGAGSGTTGTPAVPGVSISGGNTAIITLPSFGSDGGNSPTAASRSSVKQQLGPAITIVATARSGGAFNRYGELPGENYSVYFQDSAFGPLSMQYADPESATHSYSSGLTGLEPLRSDLPVGLPRSQIVVRCVIDTSGNLKIVSLLESGPSEVTVKILSSLSNWKFRPAMRGDQPVQVNAILGFNINTNDKF